MADAKKHIDAPIEIYCHFDYLPVRQHAEMLMIADNIYRVFESVLLHHFFDDDYHQLGPKWASAWGRPFLANFSLPLCIIESRTGESITFKLDRGKKFVPYIQFSKAGDLEIVLPRWTSAVILTGAALMGGMHLWQDALDIQIKQAELREHRQQDETHKLEREKLELEVKTLRRQSAEIENRIQNESDRFRLIAQTGNIDLVTVNGVKVVSR